MKPSAIISAKLAVILLWLLSGLPGSWAQVPAVLQGTVTQSVTGEVCIGAAITVNGNTTYSIGDGTYTLIVNPPGTYPVTASKPGFDPFSTPSPYVFNPGATVTLNIPLAETTNPPGQVEAQLNETQDAAHISWNTPQGLHEMIYDDGTQESFSIWPQGGNMYAVRFTPHQSPVRVIGCYLNVGDVSNYPTGGGPVGKVAAIAIYDATNPNGFPGSPIGDPVDVTITSYGWNYFDIPPKLVSAGNFYLVVIQSGSPPNASGIGIDFSDPSQRSCSRNVSAGAPWQPMSGDYMLRGIVEGSGGPSDNITPEPPPPAPNVQGYKVWRLQQGEENNPAAWTLVGICSALNMADPIWGSLPDGAYRWAVKAQYAGNRYSPPTFSNVLGKNWTTSASFQVSVSCTHATGAGAIVTLTNTLINDTSYSMTLPATGTTVFNNIWKGNYSILIEKFGYHDSLFTDNIFQAKTYTILMQEQRIPPTGLTVNPRSLVCQWNKPESSQVIFEELWDSGSLATNDWTTELCAWVASDTLGNPAPCAFLPIEMWPQNCPKSLTSKVIGRTGAPSLKLQYDISLDTYSTTLFAGMAVELWNGTTWATINTITNEYGDFPWTTMTEDISAYAYGDFRFRYRALSLSSNDTNYWYLDNIRIIADQAPGMSDSCLLGYNMYLDNSLIGFTPETTFTIPPGLVVYGEEYIAGVRSIYGAGLSAADTELFRNVYLYPPRNFQGEGIQEYAYLTWEKPIMFFDSSDAIWDIMFYFNAHSSNEAGIETNGEYIFTSKWNVPGHFSKYQQIAGFWQWVEDFTVTGVGAIRDMAFDGTYFYGGAASTTIYKIDLVNKILIGTIPTSVNVRHIAYNPDLPGFYCGDWGTMALINMNGSLAINITGLGLSSMSGSAYDNVSPSGPYLWIFDQGGSGVDIKQMKCANNMLSNVSHSATDIPGFNAGISGGLCADNGNLLTGKFILMGSILQSPSLIFAYDICNTTGGGQTPPGLLGYNLYYHQDTIPFDYLNDPDSLDYYDGPLDPNGFYYYDISAVYDMTPYGQSGQTGESPRVGPVSVIILYPIPFPFFEPWTQASFTYNDWTFEPDQGNWQITTGNGNPAPTAEFTGHPERTKYSYALQSIMLPPTYKMSCAHFYVDFDHKLYDSSFNPTQTEKLKVEVFWNNQWQLEKTIINNGNTDWISEHLDISYVAGGGFRVRFVSEGENSTNISSWMVDNIKVYFVCNPPENLNYTITQPEIFFTWEPPVCSGSNWEISGYNVYRSVNGGPYEMINQTPIPTCSYADTLPANYWSLLYYTTAWFNDISTGLFLCESIPSNIIDLSTTTPEHEGNRNVDIFPNPAGDMLTVRSSEKINKIGIFNNIGMLEKQIDGQGLLKAVLDISALPQGIYFIRIQSDGREDVRKFVVMR